MSGFREVAKNLPTPNETLQRVVTQEYKVSSDVAPSLTKTIDIDRLWSATSGQPLLTGDMFPANNLSNANWEGHMHIKRYHDLTRGPVCALQEILRG